MLATTLLTTTALPAVAQETDEGDLGSTFLGRLIFGAGAPKVAIEVPQSVTAIEETDFDRAQPLTVGDVIQQAPGVSTVGSESRFGESINIRGIGTGTSADEPRIITLIDGVRKYYESYRQGSLFVDPEFLRRVEILRGPSSATLYGSGALGGVVAFETKGAGDIIEDPSDTFAVKQQLEFRSNGEGKETSTFLAFAPDDRFEGLVGVVYDDSNFLKDGAGNEAPGTKVTETNVLVKGKYYFGQDLSQSIEAGYLRYRGSADRQVLDVIDNAPSFVVTVDRTVEDETAFLRYEYTPIDNDFVDFELQLSYGKSTNFVENYTFTPSPFFDLGVFDSDYIYEGIALKAQNTARFAGGNYESFLTFGAEYYLQNRITLRATAGNAQFQPEGTTKVFGLFAQNEYILNDRLTILGGARVDFQTTEPGPLVPTDVETEETGTAATLALHYQTTENLAIFGSVSRTERLPTVDEIYNSRATSSGANLVSTDLKPEVSLNFEVGASISADNVLAAGDEVQIKGTIYRNDVSDLIASSDLGPGTPTRVNIDEVRFTGFELEGAYDSELFFGSLAVTIQDGKNISEPTDDNPNLENRIPADTVRLSLGRRLPAQNLEFAWTATYYADKSRVSGGTTINTESELIHDVYAAWTPDQGVLEGAELRLGVSNVFDDDYREHLQSESVRRGGRSINLTLTKTF
ncbi:MAG: TonB-dependent receptor [Pseudomonadota bacterium]